MNECTVEQAVLAVVAIEGGLMHRERLSTVSMPPTMY
jgi:hypothetical protein